MIDYESTQSLNKTKQSLCIVCYWGGELDHYSFDLAKSFERKLEERGHQVVLSRVLDSWPWNPDILIVFRKEDAVKCINKNKPFFFVINDEILLNEKFEEYGEIIDKSIRSFTQSRAMRDSIGDRVNLVWVSRHRQWYTTIRKIEAHLLMGLVALNKI